MKLLQIITFFVFGLSFSQVQISGKITYRNRPVKDVNIILKDTYDGATSNVDGIFSFTTEEKGEHQLIFSNNNYNEVLENINIKDDPIHLKIALKEKINAIKAVIITAGSIQASDKERATLLSARDVYTTAGAEGQITQALTFLPGAQKVGESEGLFIRGGSGKETKIFMDGSLVNNYFNNSVPGIAGRERFNTSLFKGSVFSSGGYSALYGQALSGALILNSVDLPERSSYNFGISPLFFNADYQKLTNNKKASYGISSTVTSLALMEKILNFNTNFSKTPRSFSTNANLRFETKKGGFLKYYGSFDTNSMGVKNNSSEPNLDFTGIDLNGKNTFHNLSFRQKINKYVLDISSSYTFNQSNLDFSTIANENKSIFNKVSQKGNYLNFKTVLQRKVNKISAVRGGFEINSTKENAQTTFGNRNFDDIISSSFLETDIGFSNHLSAKIGMRGEYSSKLNKYNIAPRAALAYRIAKGWVSSLAYGIFYQNPESNLFNTSTHLDFQKSSHYILQLEKKMKDRNLRIEAFYKKYDNLVKTQSIGGYSSNIMTGINNQGDGFAKGIEVFYRDKKTLKNIDYWISYSFLDTKRDYENFPRSLTPNFAAKHTLSLVAKKFVPSWKTGFNTSYSFATGRPYYDIVDNSGQAYIRQQGKLKDYQSLNFSVNYLPNLGKKDSKAFTVLVLSVSNILGNKNVFGYNFSNDGLRKSAILPPTNTFVFLGAFISFGIDRTQEAINGNL